ncbi:carboxylating nicotinate-nucleotide diphosphorylase [bacterium]|nr:carboxylating nicotinate-nucleotide diphosphorylase [bacterium]
MMMPLNELIAAAYREDLPNGDITSELTVTDTVSGSAVIIAKTAGVFFGRDVVAACVAHINPNLKVSILVADGQKLAAKDRIIELNGPLKSLLALERVLLNFLQRLCGIATVTAHFVSTLNDPTIQILETRKTTPLLRELEKQAVVAGGGHNHRLNLSDMILIKENHLIALETHGQLDTLRDRLLYFKANNPTIRVEIEIETLAQIDTLPLDLADIVMFDNFPFDIIAQGAQRMADRGFAAQIEISGNITLDTIAKYRNLPIHRISVGALTHSVPALDLSMRITS